MLSIAGPASPPRRKRKVKEVETSLREEVERSRETSLREEVERIGEISLKEEVDKTKESVFCQSRLPVQGGESLSGVMSDGTASWFREEGESASWRREEGPVLVRYPQGGREVRPCARVEELAWAPGLAGYLKECGVSQPSRLQSLLWPAVSHLRSVLAVAGPGQGKTLGWLLPLLSLLWDPAPYLSLPPGRGPLALVLCRSQEEAARVAALAQALLQGGGRHLRVVSTGLGLEAGQPLPLYNGCDLLATSAPRLVRLLEEGAVSLDR